VQITVPEAVPTGDIARLKCDYDLEKDLLYTIKWYRGDEEFYRFVPKESPPTRVFPLQGIHVDVSTSQLTFLKKGFAHIPCSVLWFTSFSCHICLLVEQDIMTNITCSLTCLAGDYSSTYYSEFTH
jgi:hypothetical protein